MSTKGSIAARKMTQTEYAFDTKTIQIRKDGDSNGEIQENQANVKYENKNTDVIPKCSTYKVTQSERQKVVTLISDIDLI